MTSPLTAQQAIDLLRDHPDDYVTSEQLRALAAKVDADAPGKVTALYSGSVAKNVQASAVIRGMMAAGEDVRVIDNSQAARFLDSREFKSAVAKAFDVSYRELVNGAYRGPATDWLYNAKEGPWADASGRFADATKGEVRTIVNGALPYRVFGATEVPHILANPDVSSVEGISRSDLLKAKDKFGEQAPFDMIVARSQENIGKLGIAQVHGVLLKENETLLIDSAVAPTSELGGLVIKAGRLERLDPAFIHGLYRCFNQHALFNITHHFA